MLFPRLCDVFCQIWGVLALEGIGSSSGLSWCLLTVGEQQTVKEWGSAGLQLENAHSCDGIVRVSTHVSLTVL